MARTAKMRSKKAGSNRKRVPIFIQHRNPLNGSKTSVKISQKLTLMWLSTPQTIRKP